MKLQAKLTLSFIGLVFLVIFTSLFVIHWNFELQFNRFIEDKKTEWETIYKKNGNKIIEVTLPKNFLRTLSPADRRLFLIENSQETPEQRFLRTTIDSLLLAGSIGVLMAALLGFLLNKFLLRRIYGLQTAMHDYRDGRVVKIVPHEGEDEIDDLTNIYNLLIQKIEKQEKIRRDFFIDISHELRTPLTSMKGYLEGLNDDVFGPEKEKEIYKKIQKENDRMIFLVKEMTSLAKLETGDMHLDKKLINVENLTRDVIDDFSSDIEDKNLDVDVTGSMSFHLDENKFRQVVINLLDNAIAYSKPGSTISISMRSDKNEHTWSIKNTSDKPVPDDLDMLFERFYRGDKARKYDKEKPHLGIGLNIVKKIMSKHGGTVSASHEGHDVTFTLTFPRKDQQ